MFAPGTGCLYNNVGFILLGLMIESLTGLSYRDYVRTNIFEPLGMHDTEFVSMDGVFANAAEGYAPVYDTDGQLSGWRKNIYDYPPIGSPDGGAFTTAMDLDRFIRALVAGDMLSKELTQALLTPKVFYRDRNDRNYRELMGFCFHFITEADAEDKVVFLKKDGNNSGVSCIVSYYPQPDLTLIILSNQDCNVWQMSWEIHDLIYASDLIAG